LQKKREKKRGLPGRSLPAKEGGFDESQGGKKSGLHGVELMNSNMLGKRGASLKKTRENFLS